MAEKKHKKCDKPTEDVKKVKKSSHSEDGGTGLKFYSFTVPGPYTFPVPKNVKSIVAEIVGAGGGGGNILLSPQSIFSSIPGGGGGSGATIRATIPITSPNTVLNFFVGNGGAAASGTGNGSGGGNGSASMLSVTVCKKDPKIVLIAGGGSGAVEMTTFVEDVLGSQGGAGGIASVSGLCINTYEAINGQSGEGGTNFDLLGGSGGSTSGNGSGGFGGKPNASLFPGSVNNISGTNGIQPGGGGGGASGAVGESDAVGNAGTGANGIVRLSFVG